MRTPRIAILGLFFAASLFLFCRSISSVRRSAPVANASPAAPTPARFRSFFSFSGAFTLFPPNAAISLTDDNSTFFPARPAAFGPPLPAKGLSGPLWIGSGFAEDNLQDGEGEGELGCSDVPGWEDGRTRLAFKIAKVAVSGKSGPAASMSKHSKRLDRYKGPIVDRTALEDSHSQSNAVPVDDGTDDYLHQRFQHKNPTHETTAGYGTKHADIQSIQETAEITGKVVLLSRGGCGFLEKVLWAQRRGAAALIVGDNQKGGPLIQMFARGNTDNVTIPSIFTSRTTAHLLSSLMQPGSFIEDFLDENGKPMLKVQPSDKARKNKKAAATTSASAATDAKSKSAKEPATKASTSPKTAGFSSKESKQGGLFSRIFHWRRHANTAGDQGRSSSSSQVDWVMVDEWDDEKDRQIRDSLTKALKKHHVDDSGAPEVQTEDGFQIGVQDWRDPDLVDAPSASSRHATSVSDSTGKNAKTAESASAKQGNKPAAAESIKELSWPKGGIGHSGSGKHASDVDGERRPGATGGSGGSSNGRVASDISGDDNDGADSATKHSSWHSTTTEAPASGDDGQPAGHEGLWVTITPTSSASPFFDTLLVLVISPLITLTVVYALLIVRAKIRRRRWRAPKSVVERLPVRTYHTVAPSPAHSPRLPSPSSSSPTTPLLQGSSRPRPRSRTTTGVPDPADLLRVDAALQHSRPPSRADQHEKSGSPQISSEWKKYMGRQVECVVCLEEYIDGVSRVMSLPCGHEFHAECITPWLTTRRRTCPICKGDVVRSLAHGPPSSPRYEPYRDDSDDDLEAGGASSSSPNTAAEQRQAEPPRSPGSDVESGLVLLPAPRGRRSPRSAEAWFHLLSSSLGTGSGRRRDDSRDGRDR